MKISSRAEKGIEQLLAKGSAKGKSLRIIIEGFG
jgi:hypothetical protein